MSGTYFLIPLRELEKIDFKSMEDPVTMYRSGHEENDTSMEGPVPKNRSECLIW